MRHLLLAISAVCVGLTAGIWVADRPPVPMPDPAPLSPTPKGPEPAPSLVVRTGRLEILGSDGKLSVIITSRDGVPIAIVNDKGQAREIDLARVARLLK